MGYNKEYYNKALSVIASRRSKAQQDAHNRLSAIYAVHPDLMELDNRINAIGLEAVKSAVKLQGSGDLIEMHQEYKRLFAEKEKLISIYGINKADFEPDYHCKTCNDTGYCNGKLCKCAREIAKDLYFADLCEKMPLKESKFSNFNTDLYPEADRENMREILEFCIGYAQQFSPDSKSLLFFGRTGLGKTHLSLAIASAAIERGYGVIYGSSQNFLNQIQDEAFGRKDGDSLNAILDCDLLILDDFGTEFTSSYISSAVYNIINTRILRGKPTIINTNLSLSEINSTYGERIFSRIIGNYVIKQFTGKDIRQIQMLKNNP